MVNAICNEIDLRHNYLKEKTLQSIYFGGGTPSLLNNEQLVSGSSDKTIKIWDLASAICFKTFQSDSCITSVDIL
jgi:WD40 repeat protein